MVGWEEKTLGDAFIIGHGQGQRSIETISGKYPILATGGVIGRTNTFLYDKPSVLIGRKGTIDKPQYVDTPFWTIDTLFYTMIKSNYSPKFLYYLCCKIDWKQYNEASGVPSLSSKTIENIEVLLPPLPEQCAIAAALSDTDGYISALEKLIAKKRNIKQGAMQELLTGKKRLPGFSGEWKRPMLQEIAFDIKTGKKNNEEKQAGGKYPFFVRSQQIERINSYSYDGEAIIIPGEGNIGQIFHYINGKFDFHQRVYKISDFVEEVNGRYVFYQMKFSFGQYALANTVKATVDSLRIPTFEQFIVCLPSTIEEQTAIAAILSDMDAEIDVLKAKLHKAKLIKQGMMQELLTGRIRLVNAEHVEETAQPIAKRHNQQFDDAVMIAGIVNALYSNKYPLGRKKVQKCLYLLRRHQDESTAAFKKKAAGPYADEVRYKGGEPIARNAKYITTTIVKGKGTTFAPGSEISKAFGYIEKWNKQSDVKWVTDNLKYRKTDDLELLATVDMAICDLNEARTTVSIASIKHLIATNSEWKAKLEKQVFADSKIAWAIGELSKLMGGK